MTPAPAPAPAPCPTVCERERERQQRCHCSFALRSVPEASSDAATASNCHAVTQKHKYSNLLQKPRAERGAGLHVDAVECEACWVATTGGPERVKPALFAMHSPAATPRSQIESCCCIVSGKEAPLPRF